MAGRRSARTTRKPDDEELDASRDEEFAEEPDDELAEEELEDELAEEDDEEEHDDEVAEEDSRQASRGAVRSRRGHSDGLTAAKAGQAALGQVAELTGKEPAGVTGVEPAEDGWIVGVEVVEDRRIPSSTDILATYETEIDMDGALLSYRRVRRYPRGRGDNGDS